MKKVVKKTATTVKATQPVETKVVKKKPIKKVVSKKQAEPEVDEESLNLIYDEIITVAAGLGESTDEYVAVIDEATSVLVEQDQEKLEGILASTKEQVESMASKKKPSKKPVKKVVPKKKVVVDKPKVEDKSTTPEKEVVTKKETQKKGEINEFGGVKVGENVNHPKGGKGQIVSFVYFKNKEEYHPKIKFDNGKSYAISHRTALKYRCK